MPAAVETAAPDHLETGIIILKKGERVETCAKVDVTQIDKEVQVTIWERNTNDKGPRPETFKSFNCSIEALMSFSRYAGELIHRQEQTIKDNGRADDQASVDRF